MTNKILFFRIEIKRLPSKWFLFASWDFLESQRQSSKRTSKRKNWTKLRTNVMMSTIEAREKKTSSTFNCLAVFFSSNRNQVMPNKCFTFRTVHFDSPIGGRKKLIRSTITRRFAQSFNKKSNIFDRPNESDFFLSFILYVRHLAKVFRLVFLTGEYSLKAKLWKVSACLGKKIIAIFDE